MFQFLFKYPQSVFSKGEFVLLGAGPHWLLILLMLAGALFLAWRIASHISQAAAAIKNWRVWILWILQAAMVALVLFLLWQPAISISTLKPQQNVVAVLVDDSRSMNTADGEKGMTREQQAVAALQAGVLDSLDRSFQTRIYRFDSSVSRITDLKQLQPAAPATRLGDSLQQFSQETSDLPIGAVILLSDGGDNSGGIDLDTISALRSRHIPVHTVGLGKEDSPPDVEMDDAVVSPRAMAGSRLGATVSFHQHGFNGLKGLLTVRDGTGANAKVIATQEVKFAGDGVVQTESVLFDVGKAGAKTYQFALSPMPGENNRANNTLARLVNVSGDQRRILYMEGEPRWEYKFTRRAMEDDRMIQLVSMVRTTENKLYRQGLSDPKELADGFPSNAQDLFAYQGLIIGSVDSAYFTPGQLDLIHQFVDRRGGGVLFEAGRYTLGDGGWASSTDADILPVVLPSAKPSFQQTPATVELTTAGEDSLICRLVDDPAANLEAWRTLPYLQDNQDPGSPKPGAVVLANMKTDGRTMPLLITQHFGSGRTAVLASSGTWRWHMSAPVGDTRHTVFWQQLLHWLVADTPGQVSANVANPILFDDGRVHLAAQVRDTEYKPASDAQVTANIIGPDGITAHLELSAVPELPGTYQAQWDAPKAGSYLTEVIAVRSGAEPPPSSPVAPGTKPGELGRDVLTFQRMDGVAENFHTQQNRDLLEKLASQTGGRYWRPQDLKTLDSQISFSEAGVTVRDVKELWDMPVIFLALLLLRAAEWLLRRKWGIV